MKTVSLSTSLMPAMIINRAKTASGIPSTISSTRSRRKIMSSFFMTRQYSTQSLEETFPSNSDKSNPKYRALFSHLIDTMRTLSKVLCQIPEQQEFRLQASYNSRRCRKSTPEFSSILQQQAFMVLFSERVAPNAQKAQSKSRHPLELLHFR